MARGVCTFAACLRGATGIAAMALCLTACGHGSAGGSRERIGAGPSRVTLRAERAPQVESGQLTAAFTYHKGFVRFEPVADSYHPVISASRAYRIFKSSGAHGYAPLHRDPEIFLSNYTTIGSGPGVGRNNGEARGFDHVPVWVIRFAHVPSYSSGPGNVAGSTTTPGQTAVLEDVVAVENADTGKLLTLYVDKPDRTPQPSPAASVRRKPRTGHTRP